MAAVGGRGQAQQPVLAALGAGLHAGRGLCSAACLAQRTSPARQGKRQCLRARSGRCAAPEVQGTGVDRQSAAAGLPLLVGALGSSLMALLLDLHSMH